MQGEIETLKNEKRAAIELADVGKVDAIDKQIDDLEKDLLSQKQNLRKQQIQFMMIGLKIINGI